MIKNVELKVGIFIFISIFLILSSLLFVAYKKGYFTESCLFHLSSSSGDGLSEGTSVVFSGFEIGKVSKLELSPSGLVLITIKTSQEHSRWIRESSSFVLEKPLMGFPKIIVTTPDLNSNILSTTKIVHIKTVDGINEAIAKAQPVLEKIEMIVKNVETITASLSNKKSLAAMVTGDNSSGHDIAHLLKQRSLAAMATGDDSSGQDLAQILKQSADLSASLHTVIEKANQITDTTNEQFYGKSGVLNDLKISLLKLDETLKNTSKISSDIAVSTTDLVKLRTEVDNAIRNANYLILEIDSKLPLKPEAEVTLP